MNDTTQDIDFLLSAAREAQNRFEAEGSQQIFDRAAAAAAWALMQPEHNTELAKLAVAETGLGNVADKITKNHRKSLGLMRDIKDRISFGLVKDDPATGISEYLRPKGVVAAIVPSTNPLATPVNNIVNALKTGNAIILAPSPKGAVPLAALIGYIHAEFDKNGLDRNLVQMVPTPPSKAKPRGLWRVRICW